jgi:hypothetical protein
MGAIALSLRRKPFRRPRLTWNGFDLAALDTLPHGQPGNAEAAHGLVHGEISLGSFFCDAGAQIVGETNSPRRAWGELFSGDDAVVEPTMNGRGCHAERRRGLVRLSASRLRAVSTATVARDVPVAGQIAGMVGGETMTVASCALLAIENAGNDGVGIMNGEAPYQRHRILVGAHRRRTATRQIKIDLGKSATAPTQSQVRTIFIFVYGNDDLFDQSA